MLRSYKFPFVFDPKLLTNDLNYVQQVAWEHHINRAHYDGVWTGIALRSVNGTATNIIPFSGENFQYQDTPLLAECPYFQQVLETFQCPFRSIRLLQLESGSIIKEHTDAGLEYEQGEIRLHIPIITDPEVYFYLDGERIVMNPGECWYTNVKLPHHVENRSGVNRVHLVIDCDVNDWLRSYLDVELERSYDLSKSDDQRKQRYFSVLYSPAPIPAASLINALSRYRHQHNGISPQFASENQNYSLIWKDKDTSTSWIITINPSPPPSFQAEMQDIARRLNSGVEVGSCLVIETMPDPRGEYQAAFDELLQSLKAAISNASIYHAGSGQIG